MTPSKTTSTPQLSTITPPEASNDPTNDSSNDPETIDVKKTQSILHDRLYETLNNTIHEHPDLTLADAIGVLDMIKFNIHMQAYPPIPETVHDLL